MEAATTVIRFLKFNSTHRIENLLHDKHCVDMAGNTTDIVPVLEGYKIFPAIKVK